MTLRDRWVHGLVSEVHPAEGVVVIDGTPCLLGTFCRFSGGFTGEVGVPRVFEDWEERLMDLLPGDGWDMSHKMVFEGDIVRVKNKLQTIEKRLYVKQSGVHFTMEPTPMQLDTWHDPGSYLWVWASSVIGNVHSSPELLFWNQAKGVYTHDV